MSLPPSAAVAAPLVSQREREREREREPEREERRPRIAIADRVGRSFPPLACVRGFRYFAEAKVTLVTIAGDTIAADVKGKRTQHVRVQVEGGQLAAACTCAAKLVGPAACRHVWATLLEIDRRGALEGLRMTTRALPLVMLVEPTKAEGRNGKPLTRRAAGRPSRR